VDRRAARRRNWLSGAGAEKADAALERLHRRGKTGPLWELLASP